MGVLRSIVVLEGRPRGTQIVSDILAGMIHTATVLAVLAESGTAALECPRAKSLRPFLETVDER